MDVKTAGMLEFMASTRYEDIPWLPSFYGAGFECSTFRRRSGERMDYVAATQHDRFAWLDYLRLRQQGIRFAREGLRWHLVDKGGGRYDFSSAMPIIRAARGAGTQVIWDLCHFGWPEEVDLFAPEFVSRLAQYGSVFAQWLSNEVSGPFYFVPLNEISFFAWACGEEGSMDPFVKGRGRELKRQLVRASIETMEAIRAVRPDARFLHVEPAIHVVADAARPWEADLAEDYRLSQFEAFDMISGRLAPELGGDPKYLDMVGLNYYPQNQWVYNLRGSERIGGLVTLKRRDPRHRPFRDLLAEVSSRYSRPILIAETGAEDRLRAGWLRYVSSEVAAAVDAGIRIEGICLYPILNHPGWVDDRHCHCGLWDYADPHGNRPVHGPLARELRRWRRCFHRSETRWTTTATPGNALLGRPSAPRKLNHPAP